MRIITMEGKYVLVESDDNFGEYLKSCGVNFIIRTLAQKFKPVVEIYQEGEHWVWRTVTPLRTIVVRFRFGEGFETDFPDGSGRKVKVMAEHHGNKVVLTQQLEGRTMTDVKEFTEDGLVTTLTHGDIISVRTYQRVS